jgi:hypothetical protein
MKKNKQILATKNVFTYCVKFPPEAVLVPSKCDMFGKILYVSIAGNFSI